MKRIHNILYVIGAVVTLSEGWAIAVNFFQSIALMETTTSASWGPMHLSVGPLLFMVVCNTLIFSIILFFLNSRRSKFESWLSQKDTKMNIPFIRAISLIIPSWGRFILVLVLSIAFSLIMWAFLPWLFFNIF